MKKIYLSLVAVVVILCNSNISQAQISKGGIPWSMGSNDEQLTSQTVQKMEVISPDFSRAIREDAEGKDNSGPFRIALNTKVDITLNNSGTYYYNNDGSIIWRLAIEVPNAKALALYYNEFSVPEGVQYFITNDNRKQVIGAFTNINNSDRKFATSLVQGSVIHLEMDIEKGVSINDIKFNLNELSCAYRGVELLNDYATTDNGSAAKPTDGSSSCEVNANCPQGDNYENQKNATVRIFILGDGEAGYCTGTLINNTGNSANGTCLPLMLTASHCDEGNSREDNHFDQWMFYFNYQYANCDGTGGTGTSQTMTGASFKARSNYPSFSTPANSLVGDFLLLQLNNNIPSAYHAYLAGWNRNTNIPFDDSLYFFIGFHHPQGDPKKISAGPQVDPTGTFNQNSIPSTHWLVNYTVGGFEQGSSGSGLFETTGKLIGDLSGAQPGNGECGTMSAYGEYSKLLYGWQNSFDQTNFPEYAGSQSQLKDWLDPLNTGMLKLNGTVSDCSDMPSVGVEDVNDNINNSIVLYPLPSTGIINSNFNFKSKMNIVVTVYDVTGSLKREYNLSNVTTGVITYDLTDLPNGVYLMNFTTNNITASKKIIINK